MQERFQFDCKNYQWDGVRTVALNKRSEGMHHALYAISEVAYRTSGLEELCAAIHKIIRELMPAENLYIALLDKQSGEVSFPYFVDEKRDHPNPRKGGHGLTEYILNLGSSVLADADYITKLYDEGKIPDHQMSRNGYSYLGVPLKSVAGETIGVVVARSYISDQILTLDHKNLLEFISCQLAMVLQRVSAQESLRQSEERYRLLVENAAETIAVVQDGVIRFVNSQILELAGYTPDELLNRPFVELIHAEERELLWSHYEKRLRGEATPARHTIRLINNKGCDRWVELNSVVINWESRPAILNFLTDITESRRLEEQFRHIQKLESIGRLAGGVAHDFNNLLTVIIGHAGFALKVLPEDHSVREDIAQILAVAERAGNLTRQLLAFSRRQVLSLKPRSLNDLILNMHKMLGRLIGEDIELQIISEPDLFPAKLDAGHMEQALANLVVNSRDAMPHGGKLTIETKNVFLDENYTCLHTGLEPGQYVMMAVNDTGCGMSDEVKQHLFEPFFTTKEMGKGTGLGLATVHGMVKQHEGHISVYSEVGKGTTVKIYLPAIDEPFEKLVEKKGVSSLPHGSETILVVEDEPSVRRVTTKMLKQQGYVILEASDPQEALEMARTYGGSINLLVTDIIMPQMGGRELAEEIKSVRADIHILYISGYSDRAVFDQGMIGKGMAFLQKPFTTADLAHKVRDVLDKS